MKMAYPHVTHNETKRHSSRLLLISALYLCLPINSGEYRQVFTSVGGDAVLPCEVEPTTDSLAVEWSRTDLPPDQYVFFQRNGQEFDDDKDPSYEGRTSLFVDEVKKGNMSLKLSGVKSSDEGTYTCVLPEIAKTFTVQLNIVVVSADSEVVTGSVVVGALDFSPRTKPDEVSPPSRSTAGQLPSTVGLISLGIIIIIIIIIGILVHWRKKRKSRLRHCEVSAVDEDRSLSSGLMNGVSVDNSGVKVVDGKSTGPM